MRVSNSLRAVRLLWVSALLCASGAAWGDTPAQRQAMPQVPATVADWARGARLFEGLGDFHRGVTTSSPLAQQYFDQGMRFVWAFNHDEATRSFAKAAQLDPACAACYWGVALTVGPNYNLPAMEDVRAGVAAEALQRAQEQAPHASAVEQGLIAALATRYPSGQTVGPANLESVSRAYAAAMRELAQRFPHDLDVQTLCAEAAMNVHAWKLWTADGQPAEGTLEIESRLESVLHEAPGHPGANHYYIHAMEASAHPEKARAAAERLPGMMPAAGHLEHMPAHIFQRVGRYEDAAEANRKGAAADLAYFAKATPPDYYAMYTAHNDHFLAFSAAMAGEKAQTIAAIHALRQVVPDAMLAENPGADWTEAAYYVALVRFGAWDAILAEPQPDAKFLGLMAGYLYAAANALAAKGQIDEAKERLAALDALAVPPHAGAGLNRAADVVAIERLIARARILSATGQTDAAVVALTEAVDREDRLAYDEPSSWFFPARHVLGAVLIDAGRPSEAEAVYRADLAHNPANGWSLFGLARALELQRRTDEAATAQLDFAAAWRHADIELTASAF